MNISSTRRANVPPMSMQTKVSSETDSPAPKGKSFADSVSIASKYTAGGAGLMTGLVLGTKAAIGAAGILDWQDATGLFLVGIAVGGTVGSLLGSRGSVFAENIGASVSKKLGGSENIGRTLGATAVSALAGTALTGSATGALLGSGTALGGGGLVYVANL